MPSPLPQGTGAIIQFPGTVSSLTNCTFVESHAPGSPGGVLALFGGGIAVWVNCTFRSTWCVSYGGVFYGNAGRGEFCEPIGSTLTSAVALWELLLRCRSYAHPMPTLLVRDFSSRSLIRTVLGHFL